MSVLKDLEKYDFHDSLLESIDYDTTKNRLKLSIDFCNWKQADYKTGDLETEMVELIFENVHRAIIPEFVLDSDEIIGFKLLTDNEISIVVFNAVECLTNSINICAESVILKR